ncbi:MAG TPA: tetratricopeptide repeat-containing sensor histidine kinase [Ohtaekwangia sp.]
MLLIITQTGAQSPAQLVQKLKEPAHDTTRVNQYYSLSKYYWYRNADSAILMADKALELAKAINFKRGIAHAYLTKGVALVSKGNFPEALNCHLQALRISEELHINGLSGNNYNNIGIVYSSMGNTGKAIENFEKSLKLLRPYGPAAIFPLLVNIADMHTRSKVYDKALDYSRDAYQIAVNAHDSSGMAITLFNIGEINELMGHYDEAVKYLNESLVLSQTLGDREGISFSYNSLAKVYTGKKEYSRSIYYAQQSLKNSEPDGNKELIVNACHVLYEAYERTGDAEHALYYRNREIAMKEDLFSIEKERQANNLQAEHDLERKQHQIELLEKDKALQQKEIVREKFMLRTYVAGVIILAIVIIYLIISNVRWKKFNELLKERNAMVISQKQKIDEQNTHLEKLNAIKNRLISIISHDFRSPLHSLQSLVELMKEGTLTNEEIVLMSDLVGEKLNVTVQLVENMLHWAKSQMDGATLQTERFDLRQVVEENVRLVKGQADTKQVTVSNAVTSPALAYADKATVDIVLRNLMNNAIKFSRAGDQLLLSVAEHDEQYIRITVKDTGRGIPFEKQSQLFNGTAGFTTPGTSNEKGTGLGLTLCKELVEKNGGEIWFESEPGKGSSFMFTIPRAA